MEPGDPAPGIRAPLAWPGILIGCALLGGCTMGANADGMRITPTEAVPSVAMVGGQKGVQGWDGVYTGQGSLERDIGGMCESSISITEMQVAGDQVTFGDFRGSIQSNGLST